MTVSSWNKAVSGNFDNPTKWSDGVPYLTTDEADLLVAGKAYTVTVGGLHAVAELEIGANATLAIASDSYFGVNPANGAASGVSNLGAIDVGAGSEMVVGDAMASSEIFNDGSINVDGAGSTFELNASVLELDGSGLINLSDGAAIVPYYDPATLDNQSNTISGSGAIGNSDSLTLVNGQQGVIDANNAATLTLDTGTNVIENAGLIETTGAGGMVIESDLQQDGDLIAEGTGALTIREAEVSGDGAIIIENGATFVLEGGHLTSEGTITIAVGGVLRTAAYSGGDLTASDIENAGTIRVLASSSLYLSGSVAGAGKITVAGNNWEGGRLVVSGGDASLTDGRLVLSNSIYASVASDGEGEQFTNAGTISGAGDIGEGLLRLFNTSAGVIDANDSEGLNIFSDDAAVNAGSESVNKNAGTVETTGAGGLTIFGAFENSGVLSAKGAGALTLDGALIEDGAGTMQTVGSGSIVLDGATIANQAKLTISPDGVLTTTTGDSGDAVETDVLNRGTISVADNSVLIVSGSWRNTGGVRLAAGEGATSVLEIQAGADWQLLGDGTVTLNGSGDRILSGGAGATLGNHGDTIAGFGQLGDSEMTINNDANGVIEATRGRLTIEAAGIDHLHNAGSMIATSTGRMFIDASMTNNGRIIVDSGGAIDAEGEVLGTGLAVIDGAAAIEFGNVVQNDVSFRGSAMGKLIIDSSTPSEGGDAFTGDISGFAVGDRIDLRDLAFHSGQMSVSPSTFGALNASLVVSNGTIDSAAFDLIGAYTSGEFHFAGDGHGGTAITLVKGG